MNKENMQRVLDYIVAHPEHFVMNDFGTARPDCLTSACICGTANFLVGSYNTSHIDIAARFLGLSYRDACNLFYSKGIWEKYMEELELEIPGIDYITHSQAVTMLTNLINETWNFEGIET